MGKFYQSDLSKEDLIKLRKYLNSKDCKILKIWNPIAEKSFTRAEEEEWERSNCFAYRMELFKKRTEDYYLCARFRRYWEEYRQFIREIKGPTYSIDKIKELCKESKIYFDEDNPFTWTQVFWCHNQWVEKLKKKIWADKYLRDCYYTMLNPNYPNIMYEIYKMYKKEKGEKVNIFKQEESLYFSRKSPSTWESETTYSWHFLIDVFCIEKENYGSLQDFIMLLLTENSYLEYRRYYYNLHPYDRFDIFKTPKEKYIKKILEHPQALEPYTSEYKERVKKWENIEKKFLKITNFANAIDIFAKYFKVYNLSKKDNIFICNDKLHVYLESNLISDEDKEALRKGGFIYSERAWRC